MSGLDQRLRVLEAGDGGLCSSCGLPAEPRIVYKISGDLVDEPLADTPAVSTPACPRCGQRRLHVLDWDDAAPPDELARLEAERASFLASRPDLLRGSDSRGRVPDYPPEPLDEGGRP